MSSHPMIEVSHATRQVLLETSRILLTKQRTTILIPTSNSNNDLIGHTLAKDIVMREPGYPPYVASIMDGYAIDSKLFYDSEEPCGWTHRVRQKIFAGCSPVTVDEVHDDILPPCYYVTTGAVVPQGCDCVVPFEEVHISEDKCRISISNKTAVCANQWIRLPGSDIPAGSVVLAAGTVIDSTSVGLLLQAGVRHVEVVQPISIGVLSSGNEIFDYSNDVQANDDDVWTLMASGKIPDVNKPVLMALLGSFFCKTNVRDYGIARDDDVVTVTDMIRTALSQCEVLITTGGISTGESDILEQVLIQKLEGRLHFGRLNMKPGKPTTFVTVPTENGDRLVFAMPGNPASAVVCTHLLIRPCLELMYRGWKHTKDNCNSDKCQDINMLLSNALVQPEFQAELTSDVKLDIERPEYHRVILKKSENGLLQAHSTGMQRSSRLASMLSAEALLILPRATNEQKIALAGTSYHGLKLIGFNREDRIPVNLSRRLSQSHLSNQSKILVGVVQIVAPGKEDFAVKNFADVLQLNRPTEIITQDVFVGEAEKITLFLESLLRKVDVDMIIVICPNFPGRFRYQIEASNQLRTCLRKIADPMAQMLRRDISSKEVPSSGLFEVIIGYMRDSFLVFLPSEGMKSGLLSLTKLLRHDIIHSRQKE